jgi:activator of HSP90 ATPase
VEYWELGVELATIKQKIMFKVSPHEVYEALMNSEKHSAFCGSPAKISRKVGGKFESYGGYIKGENLELVEDKKIVQTWIGSDFPEGAVSKVTFYIKSDGNDRTVLDFKHENVPEENVEAIEKGWKEHYWDKLQRFFESLNDKKS